MNFLNPFILIGLFAAGIPILLHLLNLRKLKTVEFSTLRFIKELQKTKIRRLKLKQIILLILRTLIIIFAVLAFARPIIEGSIPGLENHAKTSAVILLDNSFSMDISDERGNRFNQARNAAISILKSLKEGDEAAIIRMAGSDNLSHYSFSRNIDFLNKEVSKIGISITAAGLEKSLRLAALLLEESMNINREIFIISDCQRNIFSGIMNDTTPLFNNKTGVYIIPIGFKANAGIQNLSVDSINVISRIFQIEKLVEVEASIRNSSSKDANGVVVSLLFNDERVAQRSVDVPANEIRTVSIAAAPQNPGTFKSVVEIEGDALDTDNKGYFGFLIPEKPAVALIGSPEKNNFLSLALGGNVNNEAWVNVKTHSPSEFASINPSKYDIIIVSGPLRNSDFRRLEQYVMKGGSLLIFANDGGIDILNTVLSNLGLGSASEKNFIDGEPAVFTSVDKMHPLFEGVFKGTTDRKAIVESPKIFHALPNKGGQAIIQMPGGAFLSESRPGEGKVLYCSVSPDASWSSFPFTGLFPTFIYRSIVYLGSQEDFGVNVEAGEPLVLSLPKKYASGGNFRIIDPSGTEYFKQALILPSGASLSFDSFKQLGVYTVLNVQGQTVSIVSVNPIASESVISAMSENEIQKTLKLRTGKNARIQFIDDTGNVFQDVIRARTGTELWQFFLLAALLCALAEMLVERNSRAETK